MNIIGITGPTGAGKSLLTSYLREKGIPTIDADGVYHSMLIPPSECLNALRSAFGDGVFCADGSLDRGKLGTLVFNSQEKLELLNGTVLQNVICEIRRIIADLCKGGADTVAIDAPTLIESGFHKECSTVISVLAPTQLRLERIIERDRISPESAKLRIKAQKSDRFYIENSDFVLTNDGDTKKFENEVSRLFEKLDLQ